MPKEIWINLNDFLAYIERNLIRSQVSEERLVLYSDVMEAAKESRRIEA